VKDARDLYKNRKYADGYPNLDELAHEAFSHAVTSRPDDGPRIERLFTYLSRLIDLTERRNIVILGCGPHPRPAQILINKGYNVVAVEPVQSFVETATEYLGDSASVMRGAAEAIPLPDCSQDIVIFESVLEHVDSIPHSLEEIYRVLAPGGVLYMSTTNRHRFSLNGSNGEFNVPFYNWFPRLVKESYVFQHLHYNPKLANYTKRPAVHWLTFADLCGRGRDAGFAQFYAIVDLMLLSDPSVSKSRLRRVLLPLIQQNPWLRSLALTQIGHAIFMLKRT
jgi:SAM-dependent methyltransferase